MINDDEAKGAFDRLKGKVKEGIGEATGDERLEREGELDQAGGAIRQGFGETRRKAGEVIEDIGDAIKR
jgi:uncharacterized protein YjbJ (UPF0337 family)